MKEEFEEADGCGVWLLLNLRRAGLITGADEAAITEDGKEIDLTPAVLFLRDRPDFPCSEYHPPHPEGRDATNPPQRKRGMYEGEVRLFRAPDEWWDENE